MLQRQLTNIESDALALIKIAQQLSNSYENGNEAELVQALDDNMVLWVAIKSFALNENHTLAQQTKDNLIKLSNFVASRTLQMAHNIEKETLYTFVENNLLIADGLLENTKMSITQEDAFALVNSAIHLSQAKDSEDEKELTAALDDNLQLWVAIKTVVSKRDNMPQETKENIIKIADYVAANTLKSDEKTIEMLIKFNLEIAEGLLAGEELNKTEEDAFALLQAAIKLANAKETENQEDLVRALEENIAIWVGIKTYMSKSGFAKEIKDNLSKISDFVVGRSMDSGKNMNYDNIEVLVNTNLQICEGLLERISK